MTSHNPLPRFFRFTTVRCHRGQPCRTCDRHTLDECRKVVAESEKPIAEISWDNFVTPLELATEKLGRAWGRRQSFELCP